MFLFFFLQFWVFIHDHTSWCNKYIYCTCTIQKICRKKFTLKKHLFSFYKKTKYFQKNKTSAKSYIYHASGAVVVNIEAGAAEREREREREREKIFYLQSSTTASLIGEQKKISRNYFFLFVLSGFYTYLQDAVAFPYRVGFRIIIWKINLVWPQKDEGKLKIKRERERDDWDSITSDTDHWRCIKKWWW